MVGRKWFCRIYSSVRLFQLANNFKDFGKIFNENYANVLHRKRLNFYEH